MKHCRLGVLFSACLLLSCSVSGDPRPDALLFVANQIEHSVLLVDPMSKQVLATVGVDINGHEVAVSPDGRFGYVPIYGNTWVGKPGSDGSTIHVVDLRRGRTVAVIDLGKEVRPHSAHFGPRRIVVCFPLNSPMPSTSWIQILALLWARFLLGQLYPHVRDLS